MNIEILKNTPRNANTNNKCFDDINLEFKIWKILHIMVAMYYMDSSGTNNVENQQIC